MLIRTLLATKEMAPSRSEIWHRMAVALLENPNVDLGAHFGASPRLVARVRRVCKAWQLLRSGKSHAEIAREYRIPASYIQIAESILACLPKSRGAKWSCVAEALVVDNSRSDRVIASMLQVSPTFVGKVRKRLEELGLEAASTRLGFDGRERKRPRERKPSEKKPETAIRLEDLSEQDRYFLTLGLVLDNPSSVYDPTTEQDKFGLACENREKYRRLLLVDSSFLHSCLPKIEAGQTLADLEKQLPACPQRMPSTRSAEVYNQEVRRLIQIGQYSKEILDIVESESLSDWLLGEQE